MRINALRMMGALFACAWAFAACAADSKDFSNGLTGLSGDKAPVIADEHGPEWKAQQDAVSAAASKALQAPAPVSAPGGVAPGQLGPGDKVKLTVFGEEDLSGEFEIDSTGSLAMPLVGEIPVKGLTPRELEKKITEVLNKGYLVSPRVNIEVLNFRPFFILGEVNKPGSYPYVNDLNIINAVALGGGYTSRAKTGKVTLIRASDPSRKEQTVGEDTKVYPGDVVRVEERFF